MYKKRELISYLISQQIIHPRVPFTNYCLCTYCHKTDIPRSQCIIFKELKYNYDNTVVVEALSHRFSVPTPCCVRQCRTSFPFCILGVVVLIFNFTSSLHNTCSSSGSLFFTCLGSIIFIAHYISKFITDPIIYTYIVHLLHNCTII